MTDELKELKKVLELEAQAILELKDKIGDEYKEAIKLLSDCKGKVLLTGMGKSGIIARKIASTLSSTGTPAVYLHPAECSHGDLGIISKGDVILALSNSGETEEMHNLIKYAARKAIPLIALTRNKKSTLGQAADVILEVNVKDDACPLGLAPTSSTTAALALGDAIAVTLLKKRGFKTEDFAEFHPAGSLGKRLLTRVRDVMNSEESVAIVTQQTPMKEIITKMTDAVVRGTAAVVDAKGTLSGIITDGDLRRSLESGKNIMELKAKDLMSPNPKTIDQNEMAEKALQVMEKFSIQSLFVVDASTDSKKLLGLIHIQDLLKAKIR